MPSILPAKGAKGKEEYPFDVAPRFAQNGFAGQAG